MTSASYQESWNRYWQFINICTAPKQPVFSFSDTVLLTIPLLLITFVAMENIEEHLNATIITALFNIGLILVIGYYAGIFDK